MIPMLFAAALLAQTGGPHFSEDPDAVSTPGAVQNAPMLPPAKAAPVQVIASRQQQIAAEENKEDPISCRTVETTGTRFTTRTCYRRSQWDELARQGRESYEAWSSGGAIVPGH